MGGAGALAVLLTLSILNGTQPEARSTSCEPVCQRVLLHAAALLDVTIVVPSSIEQVAKDVAQHSLAVETQLGNDIADCQCNDIRVIASAWELLDAC